MTQDILNVAKCRHTAKAYDSSKTIPENIAAKMKELLRYSPSSTNAQPWHFIIASTEEGKNRVAKGTDDRYPFNSPSIRAASHVVVFASRLDITDAHLDAVLEQEDKDGRFNAETEELKEERKAGMNGGRRMFINLHRHHYKDLPHWTDKQVYLNIGQFLLGVAALGLDATPMEGIDIDAIDEEFGLREKGYTSVAVVTVGYSHPEEDYNAKLPKSRLPEDYIITEV